MAWGLACAELPNGELTTLEEGRGRIPRVRFVTPQKLLLSDGTLLDLNARTKQRVALPEGASGRLEALPGERRLVLLGARPPLVIDLEKRSFMPFGNRNGSHGVMWLYPGDDRRFIVADDNGPAARAEDGRDLYRVDLPH